MKTIKNSKDIATLEVGDVVMFGNLKYEVATYTFSDEYYLDNLIGANDAIFEHLNINKRAFIKNLGINADYHCDFPEVCSLEALTVIVSALYKEYEKQNELPKTWEEFCERNPVKRGECFVTSISMIQILSEGVDRDVSYDKNTCTSREEAEAFLALMQLRQLRKAYVKDWEPDYKQQYYGIIYNIHGLDILPYTLVHKNMSFPTHELAKQFRNNFKDLLEIAKPLL